jgi:Protein  of unknown function (DUF3018)
MPRSTRNPIPPPKRTANYRQRMCAAGLRPIQIWVPDTGSPDFVEICRRQARAVAANDPAGDEIMRFLSAAR